MKTNKKTARGKKRAETFRLKKLCHIEEEIRSQGFDVIAGLDEVGRGPLAGPVVAAACILPQGYTLRGVNDSKKLLEEKRLALYQELMNNPAIDWGIGVVEAFEIDRINIHHASIEAMMRALHRLKKRPAFLIVDGRHTLPIDIPCANVVKGDALAQGIAAASIIAKVMRDQIMVGYHDLYPKYGFDKHKGYGTAQHQKALEQFGPCPIHRKSFLDEKYDRVQSEDE